MLTTDMARAFVSTASTKASLKAWGRDASDVVGPVATQVAPGAVVLPRTKIDGRSVFPFVCFVAEEVERRRGLGIGAVLDREAILRDVEGLDGDPLWQPPLTMACFASTEPLDKALKDLLGLRAYARTVATTPSPSSLGHLGAAEFDLAGIAVVAVDETSGHVSPIVSGYATSAPEASIPEFWIRLRQEQLFALALRRGSCQIDRLQPTRAASSMAALQAPR